MHDVLGNMEGMASEYGFRDMGGEFEILAIEPAAAHTHEIFSAGVTSFRFPPCRVA